MYRKIGREIGNIAENKVNLHGLVGWMSDIIFSHASFQGSWEKKAGALTMDISGKVLLKLRLMDGLSKKIIALVGKWGCVPGRGERRIYREDDGK